MWLIIYIYLYIYFFFFFEENKINNYIEHAQNIIQPINMYII